MFGISFLFEKNEVFHPERIWCVFPWNETLILKNSSIFSSHVYHICFMHHGYHVHACSSWTSRWKSSSDFGLQWPTDCISCLSNLHHVLIYRCFECLVDPTQAKNWKILQGLCHGVDDICFSNTSVCYSSLGFRVSSSFNRAKN